MGLLENSNRKRDLMHQKEVERTAGELLNEQISRSDMCSVDSLLFATTHFYFKNFQ